MLGFGVELPAAGDFADFDAAVFGLVGGGELFERGAGFWFFDAEGFRDLVECGGLVGGVDDGFESGLDFLWRHAFPLGAIPLRSSRVSVATAERKLPRRRPATPGSTRITGIAPRFGTWRRGRRRLRRTFCVCAGGCLRRGRIELAGRLACGPFPGRPGALRSWRFWFRMFRRIRSGRRDRR